MKELNKKQKRYYRFKRINSFVGALILIPLLSPIFLITLLINIIATHGHPFYKQQRYGHNRDIFYLYKYQSILEDGKITAWGRFIRFTSIDELPQLFNILVGQMNFIGPRPLSILEEDMDSLRKDADPSPYLVRPGLTGYGQIKFKKELPSNEKVANDVYYIEHFSLKTDLKILFITIFKMVPITIHRSK